MIQFQKVSDVNGYSSSKNSQDFKISHLKDLSNLTKQLVILYWWSSQDGSGEAYGTAAYARWRIPDQPYESRLIAAKNRIAPIKTVDIVRLELSGAVLGK